MISDRLHTLRKLMKDNKIDAYLVPSADAHQSEYLPNCWQRRRWLSGFTGSAGDLVVLHKEAGLWTDSRYFLQAEQELTNSGIDLYKMGLPETPNIYQFLAKKLQQGQAVGFDPALFSIKQADELKAVMKKNGIACRALTDNLVDQIWQDRPSMPDTRAMILDEQYSGESTTDKLKRLRTAMKEEKTTLHVLTTLDAIAWLFNIRAADIEYNPYLISYALVTDEQAFLYASKKSVRRKVRLQLEENVTLRKYNSFARDFRKLARKADGIWLDDNTVSSWVEGLIPRRIRVIHKESPVVLFKACKNATEIKGFRDCHIRDGAAMVRFMYWLDNAVAKGGVTELSAAAKLQEFRRHDKLYQFDSFAPISAFGAHGAIVHYTSSEKTNVELKSPGIYLIDSGGQYLDGTTDITRTIALGETTAQQKDHFTRVLKGHIALAMCRFPEGTQGIQLDTLARKPLWEMDLNYGHGTGHGVGHFAGVHEGPQGISYYRGLGVALRPGMVCSNEPGFYKEGEYGIRIENLIVVNPPDAASGFMSFETITFCPIDRKLIQGDMLSGQERDWLNKYHELVFSKLQPLLKKDEIKWLREQTAPIE